MARGKMLTRVIVAQITSALKSYTDTAMGLATKCEHTDSMLLLLGKSDLAVRSPLLSREDNVVPFPRLIDGSWFRTSIEPQTDAIRRANG